MTGLQTLGTREPGTLLLLKKPASKYPVHPVHPVYPGNIHRSLPPISTPAPPLI